MITKALLLFFDFSPLQLDNLIIISGFESK